jgi:hypothetical protein
LTKQHQCRHDEEARIEANVHRHLFGTSNFPPQCLECLGEQVIPVAVGEFSLDHGHNAIPKHKFGHERHNQQDQRQKSNHDDVREDKEHKANWGQPRMHACNY